jgi:hypothetical protein
MWKGIRMHRPINLYERIIAYQQREHEVERLRALEPLRPVDFFGKPLAEFKPRHRRRMQEIYRRYTDVGARAFEISRAFAPLCGLTEDHEREALWWALRKRAQKPRAARPIGVF